MQSYTSDLVGCYLNATASSKVRTCYYEKKRGEIQIMKNWDCVCNQYELFSTLT